MLVSLSIENTMVVKVIGESMLFSRIKIFPETVPYIGPCDFRPLYLTIPCILRPDISGTTRIFSLQMSLYFKTTSNLRPNFAG